jgi:hypothetical protein
MLQRAADVVMVRAGQQLRVMVVNRAGHKLPTGYVEGRRMWLQVEGYDENGARIFVSGAYDEMAGTIDADPDLKIYHSEHGLSPAWAAQRGLAPGPSLS